LTKSTEGPKRKKKNYFPIKYFKPSTNPKSFPHSNKKTKKNIQDPFQKC